MGKQNIFIKIDKLWGTIFVIILFYKRIYPFYSFTLITIWKTTITFSWFWRSIEDHKWLIPKWTHWMTKIACVDDEDVFFIFKVNRGPRVAYSQKTLLKGEEHVCRSSIISWTCRGILWSFISYVESFLSTPKVDSLKEVTLIYKWN